MKQIRRQTFETNSSSTHSISFINDEAVKKFKAGTLKVFNTDTFTVDGKKVESFKCEGATEVVKDGFFAESVVRSAPYFEFNIDGIEFLNTKF